tara:strand:- start:4532 stop:4921 length:390 start_codon:yes stop_codon:yes gene_type:complete
LLRRSFVVFLTLCGILTLAFLVLNLTGCTLKGFANVPEGQPTTPSQLRSAAAIARAEAEALDQIADQQEGVIRDIIGKVQQAAEGLGAPAIVGTALGAAGGLFVPTPGQRRREKVAAAEAKAGASGSIS